MATVEPSNELRYSPESLGFGHEVADRLAERMRELALDRVRAQHRQRVMEEDFKAVLPQAVQDIMGELGFSVTIGGR